MKNLQQLNKKAEKAKKGVESAKQVQNISDSAKQVQNINESAKQLQQMKEPGKQIKNIDQSVRQIQQHINESIPSNPSQPSFLNIVPEDAVEFVFHANFPSKSSLSLENTTNKPIIFKIRTNAPKNYNVKPKQGVVQPKKKLYLQLKMVATSVMPKSGIHKFLVIFTSIDFEPIENVAKIQQIFENMPKAQIQHKKIQINLIKSEEKRSKLGLPSIMEVEPAVEESMVIDEERKEKMTVQKMHFGVIENIPDNASNDPEFHRIKKEFVEKKNNYFQLVEEFYKAKLQNENDTKEVTRLREIKSRMPSLSDFIWKTVEILLAAILFFGCGFLIGAFITV